VYVKTGLRGCNVGIVVTSAGIVMIDTPQKPTEIVQLKKELKEMGELRYVVNSEPHPDHFTGNYFFTAPVAAHEGTRKAMSEFPLKAVIDRTNELDPEGKPQMEGYRIKLPEITFEQQLTIHLGSHTIVLLHSPGHTPSEIATYIPEEKVVFAADNVVYKIKTWAQEAVHDDWLKSLKQLAALEVDFIVPGHGDEVCSKDYLLQQETVIRNWVNAVRAAIRAGMTQEQTLASLKQPDPYTLPKGREAMAPMVDKMNIARLFQLYKK